jgi:hypothetical protein
MSKFVSWVLILVISVPSLIAQSGGAMLRANGKVAVNAKPVRGSTSISNGDSISTGKGSTAIITAEALIVSVGPESSVLFRNTDLEVSCGSVDLTTSKKVSAKVANLVISPAAESSTRFGITSQDGKLRILAHDAALSISDGNGIKLLQAGDAMTFPGSSYGACAAQPTAPAAAASGHGSFMSTKTALILAGAGGGAAVLAIALTRKHCNISEDEPGDVDQDSGGSGNENGNGNEKENEGCEHAPNQ